MQLSLANTHGLPGITAYLTKLPNLLDISVCFLHGQICVTSLLGVPVT